MHCVSFLTGITAPPFLNVLFSFLILVFGKEIVDFGCLHNFNKIIHLDILLLLTFSSVSENRLKKI